MEIVRCKNYADAQNLLNYDLFHFGLKIKASLLVLGHDPFVRLTLVN